MLIPRFRIVVPDDTGRLSVPSVALEWSQDTDVRIQFALKHSNNEPYSLAGTISFVLGIKEQETDDTAIIQRQATITNASLGEGHFPIARGELKPRQYVAGIQFIDEDVGFEDTVLLPSRIVITKTIASFDESVTALPESPPTVQGIGLSLRSLILFLTEGPATGYPSGSFKEIVGGIFPSSVIWWTSAAKIAKIVEKTIVRNPNQTPSTVDWKLYASDGTTVIEAVTDAITYSGVIETSRTRTITP